MNSSGEKSFFYENSVKSNEMILRLIWTGEHSILPLEWVG